MTKPLALLLHDKLMPGTQLVTRLEELQYRTRVIAEPDGLVATAEAERPMVVLVDLTSRRQEVLAAIAALRGNVTTRHVPVIAYSAREDEQLRATAQSAGARLLANDVTIVLHLEQFLEQALQIE